MMVDSLGAYRLIHIAFLIVRYFSESDFWLPDKKAAPIIGAAFFITGIFCFA